MVGPVTPRLRERNSEEESPVLARPDNHPVSLRYSQNLVRQMVRLRRIGTPLRPGSPGLRDPAVE